MSAEEGMSDAKRKLLEELNAAVKAANEAQVEQMSRSRKVGLLLLEAKKLHPTVRDFDAFLEQVQGLSLSRAYDLMRLAGGRTTDDELRKDARERQQRHREKKRKLPKPEPKLPEPKLPPKEPFRDVTETTEESAERRRAENARFLTAEELSEQALVEFISACQTLLPRLTVEAHRERARGVVLEMLGGARKKEAA
jgi:hypothetical protein